MNILWVVSQVTPDMAVILGLRKSNFGGWVQNMLNELKKIEGISISVVGGASDLDAAVSGSVDHIDYYILPFFGKNKSVKEEDISKVIDSVNPDIIHIEGTEWSISNQFVKIEGKTNIVSLQGILSGYERYQFGSLSVAELMFSLHNFNWVVGWTLFLRKKLKFNHRIPVEIDTISCADNLLGRTLWDRAHSYHYNPTAPYFECSRILRPDFYKYRWNYSNCRKHSIFIGNGYSALKGSHFVLDAVAQLKREFPDIHLYIAGTPPFSENLGFKARIGYALYVKKKIESCDLEQYITYTGELNSEKMVDALLKANVYVLPSLIENSPNTLGEAMLMGVPAVSAYTGGVPTMAKDEDEVLLYRADDATMLAWQIRRVFLEKEAAGARAEKARAHAAFTHDPKRNCMQMIDIYKKILKEAK